MAAARDELRALVKASPYTVKQVAALVGEEYTGFSKRLHGTVEGYRQLDTALVLSVLAVLDEPVVEFFTRVEARAQEILRAQR